MTFLLNYPPYVYIYTYLQRKGCHFYACESVSSWNSWMQNLPKYRPTSRRLVTPEKVWTERCFNNERIRYFWWTIINLLHLKIVRYSNDQNWWMQNMYHFLTLDLFIFWILMLFPDPNYAKDKHLSESSNRRFTRCRVTRSSQYRSWVLSSGVGWVGFVWVTNLPKRKCRDSKKVLGVRGIDHDRPIELQEASRKSGILPTLKIFKDILNWRIYYFLGKE